MRGVICALACALMVVALGATPSEARGLKKISSISRVGQDWAHGRLKVSWRGAKGVTYQWRYAASPSALLRTRAVWSGTSRGTYTRTLDRGKPWFFQVRAYKKGVVGPWSRTRQLRFLNRWPNTPVVNTTRLSGAVQWNWGTAANASRYRVRWSPAWYGSWPGSATYTPDGWLGQGAHSSKYTLPATPQPGDGMLGVAYANPVFGQVQAQNQYITNGTGIHQSKWFPIWAKAPVPAPGDAVRFGTYNVMLNPTSARAAAAAHNIAAHGLTMVALQEANSTTAAAVVGTLGSAWRAVPTSSASQQILYRADLYNMLAQSTYQVDSPRDPSNPVVTPWARFSAKNPVSPNSQAFYVSSVHFAEDPSKSAIDKNADTGHNARQAMSALGSIDYAGEPLIVAGDMRYGREPWGEVSGHVPAQPTFIRGGFYDAMASQSMTGHAYSTLNSVNGTPTAKEAPNPAGLGPRADYILMKGIVGSRAYTNVVNYTYGGIVPSDHNLVYSDILVPTR